MDIVQFQNKLKEIQTLAMQNGKKVQAALVEKFFDEEDMDREKLQKVYDFLEIQGIHIEGYEKKRAGSGDGVWEANPGLENQDTDQQETEKSKELIPLTAEEEEYLQEYLETFAWTGELVKEELLEALVQGEEAVKEQVIRCCQEDVVKAAREFNREEIFFGDPLQEGNMGLLMAMEHAAGKEDVSAWLQNEIRSTMRLFIEDQTQQKKEDDILVEKVRNLEARVKELTEDEDVKYSVEELAVFLDMDVEEMQSVLRLTGDDK